MRARALLVLLALLPMFGCHCSHDKLAIEPPLPVPAGDGGDPCSLACTKLCLNKCAAGCNPACTSVCERDQAQGSASQLDPQCILSAQTVPAIEACGATCN